jgi:hypothetical protein
MNYILLTVLAGCLIVSAALTIMDRGSFPLHLTLLTSLAAMIGVIVAFGLFTRRESGAWIYSLAAPIGIVLSGWIALRALVVLLTDRGISWRGSLYK